MNCNDCGTFIDAQSEDVGGYILCLKCMVEREKDLVVGRISFEMPTVNGVPTRPVKVIKKTNRPPKTADDYEREHLVALWRLLSVKHPQTALKLAGEVVK